MYTGNTTTNCRGSGRSTVYPCVYREHLEKGRLVEDGGGLSLCIQGTLQLLTGRKNKSRFIPVYTGNTLYQSAAPGIVAVYPCVYREHVELINMTFY